ncbi:ATP-dependent DNA helicase [Nesterenkonia alkaliphila]|uniref:ATP-dependent helicase DinG n=1 Tax=Nesterenkonia alkaliphila TaxID=1463631 RepID=A0A7K1UI87_9MICC|nr:ATP-dependent DNA helicase [Nesterenkonia alkaliphila]MVT26190.1 DEAD/DEAH box helicase [Nesterenkonia alkaliphila]GFZ84359.1 ATP-dependent helicase [Nesterenkonia alkaliphila]
MSETAASAGKLAERLLDTAVDSFGGARRPGQEQMARRVGDALSTGKHLLVQAGTGTGKSLAYLVPAVHHAVTTGKPVLVSTATLALQAQIMGRDLPRLLSSIEHQLPRKAKVALVKGRSNYLCKQKLAGGFPEDDHDQEALFAAAVEPTGGVTTYEPTSKLGKEVAMLRDWAEETDTGDRDDLPSGVTDRAWRQVSVNAVDCLGRKCSMFEECFSELARQDAKEADLVVTNHAMLAIDAFEGLEVLPEHDAVIIDEAHELAERVTSAVTAQLSAQMIQAAASSMRKYTALEVEGLQNAAKALEAAFSSVADGLLERGLNPQQVNAVESVRNAAKTLLADSEPNKNKDQSDAEAGRTTARARLQAVYDAAERILGSPETPDVVWVDRPGSFVPGKGYQQADLSEPPMLYVAPTTVAGRLREGLFGSRTVVLTSATLTIGDSFDPVAGSLGLLGEGAPAYDALDVGTPFNYRSQGILYVASHLPAPSLKTKEAQHQELAGLIEACGGATLGLFSSRRAAEEAAEALRERLEVPILCQGDSTMSALVREFSEDEATCLFGTMSLWQGVDVPGRSCRMVAIDRIPFPRPDDPLNNARSQEIARAGGNGFMQVAATHAAVRLSQGAGRLIRSTQDRGVLAILDSRLAHARYGGFLRKSMPDLWPTTDGEFVRQALARLR